MSRHPAETPSNRLARVGSFWPQKLFEPVVECRPWSWDRWSRVAGCRPPCRSRPSSRARPPRSWPHSTANSVPRSSRASGCGRPRARRTCCGSRLESSKNEPSLLKTRCTTLVYSVSTRVSPRTSKCSLPLVVHVAVEAQQVVVAVGLRKGLQLQVRGRVSDEVGQPLGHLGDRGRGRQRARERGDRSPPLPAPIFVNPPRYLRQRCYCRPRRRGKPCIPQDDETRKFHDGDGG